MKVTPWAPVLVVSGIIMQKRGMTAGQALAFSAAFEAVENSVGPKLGLKAQQDAEGMVADVALNMLGHFLGSKI